MEWRKVEGLSRYSISETGIVKADAKVVNSRFKTRRIKERILNPRITEFGYHILLLTYDDSKSRTVFVHKLVLMAFKENPNNKKMGNHINGNKTDNRAINLEWCTHAENVKHAYDTSLIKKRYGANNKISIELKKEIISSNKSSRDLSMEYGVSDSYIRFLKRNSRAYLEKWK